jgi:Cu/Ag efflux protein CusF
VFKGIISDTIYELNKDATVWLDGARCKLADLKADDRVTVVYEKKGEHLMASQVRGLRKAQEAIGIVADVLGEKKEFTLKGTLRNTTYELHKTATIWVNGKRGALNEIRAGDQVLVTYEQRGQRYMVNDVTVLKRK